MGQGRAVQGRYVNSFREGQKLELEQWSWRRRDGPEGCSGDKKPRFGA